VPFQAFDKTQVWRVDLQSEFTLSGRGLGNGNIAVLQACF
jgi:hypothetical protein